MIFAEWRWVRMLPGPAVRVDVQADKTRSRAVRWLEGLARTSPFHFSGSAIPEAHRQPAWEPWTSGPASWLQAQRGVLGVAASQQSFLCECLGFIFLYKSVYCENIWMPGLDLAVSAQAVTPDCLPQRLADMELVGYLERWCLQPRSSRGNHYLHHILTGDEPVMHDHPWDFESEILLGGYLEMTEVGLVQRNAGTVYCKAAADLHYIVSVLPDTWTRIRTGPKVRDWGFVHGGEWVSHIAYGGRRMQAVYRNGYAEGSLAG